MSIIGSELTRQGGIVQYVIGQLMTSQEAGRMGTIGNQTLMHLLMMLFRDDDAQQPMSGFPEVDHATNDGHCQVVADAGALDIIVRMGLGFAYLGGATSDEFAHEKYRMIVNEADASLSHDAHDATNPRIDLVVIEPLNVDDQTVTRTVKNPSTGVETTPSVDLRKRFSRTITIVKGTAAATPATPITPTGSVLLATVQIPAVSGNRVIIDGRPLVSFGHLFKGHPSSDYIEHWIPDTSHLTVSPTTPNTLAVILGPGISVVGGQARRHSGNLRRTLATADPTNPRIDSVIVGSTGILAVITGTPAASPVAPSGTMVVAHIAVAALATTIGPGDITDMRTINDLHEPFIGDNVVRLASLSRDRLGVDEILPVHNLGALVGDDWSIGVQIKSIDDTNPLQSEISRSFLSTVYDADGLIDSDVSIYVSTGATANNNDGSARLFWTSTSSDLEPDLIVRRTSGAITGNYYLVTTPTGTVGHKGVVAFTFT